MKFSEEQIAKIKFIYQKQVEINNDNNKRDQWSFIWTMGTDFFTHLCRINALFIYLLKTYNLDLDNEEIFLEWKESVLKVRKKSQEESRYYLNIYKRANKNLVPLTSAVYNGNKGVWIFEIEDFFNDKKNIKKIVAKSTMRQFLEVTSSLGYLEIQKAFAPKNYFNLIFKSKELNDYIIDKQKLASIFFDSYKSYFNLKYIKGYSIRDIFFSLHTLFLYELCSEKFPICLDIEVGVRSKKNQIVSLPKLFKTHKNGKSSMGKHFETQTTIRNLIKKDMPQASIIFNNLNDFLYEKYINGWKTTNLTIQSQVLEYSIKKNHGRTGQVKYRQLLLNDIKRIIEVNHKEFINKNDLIKGMEDPFAIEASHIVDYAKCDDNEEYDSENGLLLGATIHKLFDQDQIVFDLEGNIWIESKYYDQIVRQIKSEHLERTLIRAILTPETKKYLEKRISLNEINFDNYQQYK